MTTILTEQSKISSQKDGPTRIIFGSRPARQSKQPDGP